MQNYNSPPYQGYGQQQQQKQQQQGGRLQDLTSSFSQFSLRDQWSHLSSHFPQHREGSGEIVCGPLLRYIGINYATREWQGSILIVSSDEEAPPVDIQLAEPVTQQKQWFKPRAEKLDTYRHKYRFWRYDVRLPMTNHDQIATYSTARNNWASPQFQFHLPSFYNSMRFMFYSCNGFSDVPQEIKNKFGEKEVPLWQDVLDRHTVMPFHVLLGGGDQLYQDRLIKEDFMKPWVEEKNPAKRLAMELSEEMKDGFEHFYFWNYCKNFG